MAVAIRAYTSEDAAACARIFDLAWHAGHPYLPRRIDLETFDLETFGETVLVAEDKQGKVVGFVAVYEPSSFIHHLYVDPAAHGVGVGRALLDRAVALAGGQASLKCQLRNATALGFYHHLGWTAGEAGEADTGPWVRMHSPGPSPAGSLRPERL